MRERSCVGKSYEVVHANSKSVTVKYDSTLADFKHFGPVVDEHCAKFGKEAVPDGRKDSQFETISAGFIRSRSGASDSHLEASGLCGRRWSLDERPDLARGEALSGVLQAPLFAVHVGVTARTRVAPKA
jgi:hypothetical protein